MRTFLTPDGKSGVAVKDDGDIVSVFKHPDSGAKGFASSALALATQEGGNKLDAFDTVLPRLYSEAGFRAVARLPFDDKYAPPGWDYKQYGAYNGGRPDVVFMVHDPEGASTYKPGDGKLVATYEDGQAEQQRVLDELKAAREGKSERAACWRRIRAEAESHLARLSRGFDPNEPRDESGRWTDGGGSDGGDGAKPSDGGAPKPAPTAPLQPAGEPQGAKPSEPAQPAETGATKPSSEAKPSGGGGGHAGPEQPKLPFDPPLPPLSPKTKPSDFAKDKIELIGDIHRDQEKAQKFAEQWDLHIHDAPAKFKEDFLGGLNGTMMIKHEFDDQHGPKVGDINRNEMEMRGYLQDADGARIGEYIRTIDFHEKKASSDFFTLKKGVQGKDTAKRMLAANVAMYQKLGLNEVEVHANIDVGGYAWAKYGYVPTDNSWRSLRSEIEDNIDKLAGGSGYTAGSWDEMSSDQQDRVERSWMESTFEEFQQSEIDNWYESGQPVADAKTSLAETDLSDTKANEWAYDGLSKYAITVGEGDDVKGVPIGKFLADKGSSIDAVLANTTLDYNDRRGDGTEDPTVTVDPEKTPELNDDQRQQVEDALVEVFNKEAEHRARDAEPPDFSDSIADYQRDVWDQMRDKDKFDYAERNDLVGETDGGEAEIDQDTADALRDLVNDGDPHAVWAIADSPHGKELLLGTDWYGTLDLKDSDTMARFNAYIAKGKNAATAPVPVAAAA